MLYLRNLIRPPNVAKLRLGNMCVLWRDAIRPSLGRSGSRTTWNNTKEFSLSGASIQAVAKLSMRNQTSKFTWEYTLARDPSSACMDVVKDSGPKLTAKTIQEDIWTSGKWHLLVLQFKDYPCTFHSFLSHVWFLISIPGPSNVVIAIEDTIERMFSEHTRLSALKNSNKGK